MRKAAELLLLLIACGILCFVAGLAAGSNRTIVSGTVIDWTTGKPVPHVMVYFRDGGKEAGYTDEKGRFTATGPRDGCCFVLVWDKRFGKLLQAQFGGGFVDARPGWWRSGIVVPVIPSTELSGHVYSEDGKPIAGCGELNRFAVAVCHLALKNSGSWKVGGRKALLTLEVRLLAVTEIQTQGPR